LVLKDRIEAECELQGRRDQEYEQGRQRDGRRSVVELPSI
jgi:hypothetical protein